jgi:hypothetical protein
MGHRESVWDRPGQALSDQLEHIADELEIITGGFGGSSGSLEGGSGRPFRSETTFHEAWVSVEFIREGDCLRYVSRIGRHRKVLAEGPTGIIDVHNGFESAVSEIDAAFARIARFIDRKKKVIGRAASELPRWW